MSGKDTYVWPEGVAPDHFGVDHLVAPVEGDPFHVGYNDPGLNSHTTQLKCAKCSGTEFHIASGLYLLAVRCVKCRWEYWIGD